MSTPLRENILHQAEALRSVAGYQFGAGLAALERAAELVLAHKRIVLSGMGASYFVCIPLEHQLRKLGFDVTCVETAELLYFGPAFYEEDTLVVLVSRSGESVEVTRLLGKLRETKAAVLGVVNVPESTLSREANHSIVVGSPADQLVAIQTYTGTLAVFSLLAAAVGKVLTQAQGELTSAIEVLSGTLPGWVEQGERMKPFLDAAGPIYVLGRGAAMGAVLEGALLMHETAKAATVGMSIPQFRHGPVEVVDGQFRAIVIGTQAQTMDLDAAFAKDLKGLGAQVRWIGPGEFAEALCAWPADVPARFAPVFETIPLQIAAYAKAELRGVRPGDFRWAPAITSTETGFLNHG